MDTTDQHPVGAVMLTLSPGRLYAVTLPYALDGRPVTTHPAWARGFGQMNCYVLVESDRALLIDTGFAVHGDALIDALGRILDASTQVSIAMLRVSEYSSVSNARQIVDHFCVNELMMGGGIPPTEIPRWVDFHPGERPWGSEPADSVLTEVSGRGISGRRQIGPSPGPLVEVMRPDLQLLPTVWLYDAVTRTLFTSDAFGHVWRSHADEPRVVRDVSDGPSVDELCDYLLDTRYWWLAGAKSSAVRESLAAMRSRHAIERIAPVTGCILDGADVVARHFDLFDAAIERLGALEPIGPSVVAHYVER